MGGVHCIAGVGNRLLDSVAFGSRRLHRYLHTSLFPFLATSKIEREQSPTSRERMRLASVKGIGNPRVKKNYKESVCRDFQNNLVSINKVLQE
jgi:hypothetical protein